MTARAHPTWLAYVQRFGPMLLIATAAVMIAWGFVYVTLHHTSSMGLPLDDSYIYLTYAKQAGRGQPFTYFPGGGYSAGSTSVLWPMLLAPFWSLGARGHALVWVSFGMCTALYAAVAIGCWRFGGRVIGRGARGQITGAIAATLVLGVAPFAWGALSGMEVAFAAALLIATLLLLVDAPRTGPPRKLLVACLAATSLSRPEATLLVIAVVGVAMLTRLRARQWRAALWWVTPLVPAALWLAANKLLAGNLFPNTGVAKSHFYLPGFEWAYWFNAIGTLSGRLLAGLFWDPASPLVWPRAIAVAWIVGAVRVGLWAARERRWLVGVLAITAPGVLMLAVIASSGLWSVQNYRYIAPAFPLVMLLVAIALAPPRWIDDARRTHRWAWPTAAVVAAVVFVVLELAHCDRYDHGRILTPAILLIPLIVVTNVPPPRRISAAFADIRVWLPLTWLASACVLVAVYAKASWSGMRADMQLFAQGATDTNTQVVAIGRYLNRELPDARVMFHDAGAIAYYGDGRVFDMLGLVTNYQTGVANNGPGSRFEFLESLPPERRPTHFAYYPGWMGTPEFYGDVVLRTPIAGAFEPRRLAGDADMQIIVANWDHVGTGERPLDPHPGWAVIDRVDIADLVNERAHAWHGKLGTRHLGDPTARWSLVEREVHGHGLVIDGGRTIRAGGEQFAVELDPGKPTRLVLRTGGQRAVPYHETIEHPVELTIAGDDGRVLAHATAPTPTGVFVEIVFELPAHTFTSAHPTIHVVAPAPYRAFHWFVLQPEVAP